MIPRPSWIPEKLYINGREWSVLWVAGTLKNEEGINCHGITDVNDRTISLEESPECDRLRETWIHELLHAVLPSGVIASCSLEERIVDGIAGPLSRAISDNGLTLPQSEQVVIHKVPVNG
jgi:hypothetical protein